MGAVSKAGQSLDSSYSDCEMKISSYSAHGDYHVGAAFDQRQHSFYHDVIVVPSRLYADMQRLGLVKAAPQPTSLPPASQEPINYPKLFDSTSKQSPAFSNLFESSAPTRRGFLTTARSMYSLGYLLKSLRDEAVLQSIVTKRRRPHPANAVLAALSTTSCRLDDIATVLHRPRRVVDKWLQRLRRDGVVDYDRRVGWFLK